MASPLFITDVLKQVKNKYLALISDAQQFYAEFDDTVLTYQRELDRLNEAHNQLETIVAFEKANGYYPAIKDQSDTELYLGELQNIVDKSKATVNSLEPKILGGFRRRTLMVNELADIIIENTLNEKDANKFITSLVLRSPLPQSHSRCPSNEKNKPIYIAAWSICLFHQLIKDKLIDDERIVALVPRMIEQADNEEVKEPDPEMLNVYIKEVLRPIVSAALLHQIGSYSLEADSFYKGNRYRLLGDKERQGLISVIFSNTKKYIEFGLGKPDKEAFHNQQAEDYQNAMARYDLMESILDNYIKPSNAMGNLLRIPMIYASFLLSTKPKHDYSIIYKAYDIIKSGIEKDLIHAPFAKVFLKLVGQYPLGAGIYFISKETGQPERAIVIGMNPNEYNSAIVKQITRRQIKYDDFSQALITFEYNLLNDEARKNSDFGAAFYAKQFPRGYTWNPAEVWEIEINQDTFWRRDNAMRKN